MALDAFSALVVVLEDLRGAKKKGRRSWDGGPSGLLRLQTPGLAERRVGRSLKFRDCGGA
jgi:hypothetical protein